MTDYRPLVNVESENGGYPEPASAIAFGLATCGFPEQLVPFQEGPFGLTVLRPFLYNFCGITRPFSRHSMIAVFSAGPLPGSEFYDAAMAEPVVWADDIEAREAEVGTAEHASSILTTAVDARIACAKQSIDQLAAMLHIHGLTLPDEEQTFNSDHGQGIQVFAFNKAMAQAANPHTYRSSYLNYTGAVHLYPPLIALLGGNAIRQDIENMEGYDQSFGDDDRLKTYDSVIVVFSNWPPLNTYGTAGSIDDLLTGMFAIFVPGVKWVIKFEEDSKLDAYQRFLDTRHTIRGTLTNLGALPPTSLAQFQHDIESIALGEHAISPTRLWTANGELPTSIPTSLISQQQWFGYYRAHPLTVELYQTVLMPGTDISVFTSILYRWLRMLGGNPTPEDRDNSPPVPEDLEQGEDMYIEGPDDFDDGDDIEFDVASLLPNPALVDNMRLFPAELVAVGATLTWSTWRQHDRPFRSPESFEDFLIDHRGEDDSEAPHERSDISRWPFWMFILSHDPVGLAPFFGELAVLTQQIMAYLRTHGIYIMVDERALGALTQFRNEWVAEHMASIEPDYGELYTLSENILTCILNPHY